MKLKAALAATAAIGTCMGATSAQADSNPFIGEIEPVGFTFCPRGWTAANGQLLAIAQNQALFSLYGTIYGGDGRTTFALPDLRGRVPIHQGTGPGLTPRQIGQRSGSETNTLNITQLPSHNHSALININNTAPADSGNPTGNVFARSRNLVYEDTNAPSLGQTMNAATVSVGNTGGGQSVNNMQPYTTLNYCVALVGVFPSRN